jgi:DNA-directed RNA polymerase subunit M/transcription elongation factor TFIIS
MDNDLKNINLEDIKYTEIKTKIKKYIKKEQYIKKIIKGIYDFSSQYAHDNEVDDLLIPIFETKLDEILEALCNNLNLVTSEEACYNLAFLPPEELNPTKYEVLLKKQEITEYKKNNIKSSSAFKCAKCKKKKCSVSQKQILAGDEPLTTFVTCLECGHSFSFH